MGDTISIFVVDGRVSSTQTTNIPLVSIDDSNVIFWWFVVLLADVVREFVLLMAERTQNCIFRVNRIQSAVPVRRLKLRSETGIYRYHEF